MNNKLLSKNIKMKCKLNLHLQIAQNDQQPWENIHHNFHLKNLFWEGINQEQGVHQLPIPFARND